MQGNKAWESRGPGPWLSCSAATSQGGRDLGEQPTQLPPRRQWGEPGPEPVGVGGSWGGRRGRQRHAARKADQESWASVPTPRSGRWTSSGGLASEMDLY